MSDIKYLVRQYRPNYFSGFETQVVSGLSYDEITSAPFCENFKHGDFKCFTVSPYADGDELIIEAHYKNGAHWVAGFALPENSEMMSNNGDKMRDNWRYKSRGPDEDTGRTTL